MPALPDIAAIVRHTPYWVFGLFLLLISMGMQQWRGGSVHFARATLVPVGMACLSLYGALAAFGQVPSALLGWALAAALAGAALVRQPLPAAARYDVGSRRFNLPGSGWPLVLMMAVFCTKYSAGVALALHPGLAHDSATMWTLGLLYGAFSGIFAGRSLRLFRLSRRCRLAQGDTAKLTA